MKTLAALVILTPAMIDPVYAQATRTWVSGVGDDANPCSRTAPCKTFAGAISKTAQHGEISVLDPGGFGAVTITKSITLNGDGTLAGILAAGTNGIVINAGASDIIKLHNLSINGAGSGLNGVRFLAGEALEIENVAIDGFTQSGIDVSLAGGGRLSVKNSSIHVSIQNTGTAVDSLEDVGSTWLSHCTLTGNSAFGAHAEAGIISLDNCLLTGNAVAVQAETGATVRLIDNDVFDNATGFGCGGGVLFTNKNNRKGDNTDGDTLCKPKKTIAKQ
ncbi:hypothetical protein [Methylomicrobium lacus]|uniref:hypothetical protein n=1 Tax=Methylomicrobium lacus TaxID=136992 RepID=UPI0012681AC3|nr:hypothetical protein [Methylomicrobium lacus]